MSFSFFIPFFPLFMMKAIKKRAWVSGFDQEDNVRPWGHSVAILNDVFL